MVSRLERIFQSRPFQTEPTDIRQGIRREGPDRENSKNENQAGNSPNGPDDDIAVVSVSAITLFLKSLLKFKNLENHKAGSRLATEQASRYPEALARPVQARAAAAYSQNASRAGITKEERSLAPENPDTDQTPGGEEAREIFLLIADLQQLEKEGIREMTIVRAESFLDSVRYAIENARVRRL